jgi:hypothetical protein
MCAGQKHVHLAASARPLFALIISCDAFDQMLFIS